MTRKQPTLPAQNPSQPTASQFYHFARERREPVHAAPTDIREELARRERIKNDDAEQDIILKRTTLNRLFWFLATETVAIFVLAVLQGFEVLRLEEWSFKLLTTATIAQITAMLFVAVRYLFPTK
jgi:hypothetical protein